MRLYSQRLFEQFSGDKVLCWLSILDCINEPASSLRGYPGTSDTFLPENTEHQDDLDALRKRWHDTSTISKLDDLFSFLYSRKRSLSMSYSFSNPISSPGSDKISLCSSESLQPLMSLGSSMSSGMSSGISIASWRQRPRKGRELSQQRKQSEDLAPNNSAGDITRSRGDQFGPGTSNHQISDFFPGTPGEQDMDEIDLRLLQASFIRDIPKLYQLRHAPLRDDKASEYQCTQCVSTKKYRIAYTWRRHEMTAHFPSKVWVCAPQSIRMCDSQTPCTIKAYDCGCKTTLALHKYRFESCWERPIDDRVFDRMDSMRQHLRVYHRLTASDAKMLSEESTRHIPEEVVGSYGLNCHFCGYKCDSIEDRFEHIEKHFSQDQMTVQDWLCLRTNEDPHTFLYRVRSHLPFTRKKFGKLLEKS